MPATKTKKKVFSAALFAKDLRRIMKKHGIYQLCPYGREVTGYDMFGDGVVDGPMSVLSGLCA